MKPRLRERGARERAVPVRFEMVRGARFHTGRRLILRGDVVEPLDPEERAVIEGTCADFPVEGLGHYADPPRQRRPYFVRTTKALHSAPESTTVEAARDAAARDAARDQYRRELRRVHGRGD